ncbi:MAG: Wzz/FepE/Etk N-terminal domain-containing protein [Porticoccus sp.]
MKAAPQEPYPSYPDEIDLFQLCADLWRKRVLIMLCAVAFLACGVGYAYWAPEVYKAEVRLLPPPAYSLSQLAVTIEVSPNAVDAFSRMEVVAKVSPAEAFALTMRSLGAVGLKKELLNSPVFSGYIDKAFPEESEPMKLDKLSKLMSVSFPNVKQKKNHMMASIQWQDPDQAAELVNAWVDLAMQHAKDDLIKNAGVSLQREIRAVERQIAAKKKLALKQLDTELRRLREAKEIADQLGLLDPIDLATEGLVIKGPNASNVMGLRSLYFLGSKALFAELDVLDRRRAHVEEYVAGLIGLEEKLSGLQGITIDQDLVKTARIDAPALPPERRIKPKRIMVMLGSLVFGVMVGLFVALIDVGLERRKIVSLHE